MQEYQQLQKIMIMKEKINIAELLKDCPKGMKLDCLMCDGLEFDGVKEHENIDYSIVCRIKRKSGNYRFYTFTEYGCYDNEPSSKCVIFPKGKTTWEGFQRPFKDGDILTCKSGSIFIYKGPMYNNNQCADFYCGCRISDEAFVRKLFKDKYFGYLSECRLATEEEKQKLFQVINDNGYIWDPETKTLGPKFNDGDVVFYNDVIAIFKEWGDATLFRTYVVKYLCNDSLIDKNVPLFGKYIRKETRFASEEEKEKLFKAIKDNGYKWNTETKTLEKLIVPKFKVGDKIKKKGLNNIYAIEIASVEQIIYTIKNGGFQYIESTDRDYELVPSKFDITTLKPFESRVLVRTDNRKWVAAFYSHYDKGAHLHYCVVGGLWYEQCIPYNDETKHLLDTTDNCYDYYKTWE